MLDALDAARRVDQIARGFDTPFTLDGAIVECRPSIGVAVAPNDGDDPASLLRHADAALYKAKRHRNGAADDRRELGALRPMLRPAEPDTRDVA